MTAEQAIFTSMVRRGKSGYHVVSRSPGVTDSEASTLATWSPSHGGLIVDETNHVSVNFFPLPSGRFAITRTREGRPEFSGRGGKQLYTHALIVDASKIKQAAYQPFSLYRDALALGHLYFNPDPDYVIAPLALSSVYPPRDATTSEALTREIGVVRVESIVSQLESGQSVILPYAGDRAALAEMLVGKLPDETVMKMSFATSLRPSSVRPYRLNIVAAGTK